MSWNFASIHWKPFSRRDFTTRVAQEQFSFESVRCSDDDNVKTAL